MKRRRKSKRQKIRRIQAYVARTVFVLILVAFAAILFFGGKHLFGVVSSAFSGTTISGNSIKISKSGEIKETVNEDFDTKEYSEDDLRKLIDETISDYNSKASEANAVKLSKLTVKNNKAVLIMEYKGAEFYSDFNNVPVTVSETGDGTKLSLNMDITVIAPSKIKDKSAGVELLDDKTAVVTAGDTESYIVY